MVIVKANEGRSNTTGAYLLSRLSIKFGRTAFFILWAVKDQTLIIICRL